MWQATRIKQTELNFMNIIKGVIGKVASHKLAVTAAATGAVDITLPVAIVAAAYIIGQAMMDASGE
jgi:hypothetical protein